MKLSEMKENESGVVVKVGGEGEIHRRLLDMGLIKGAWFTIVRRAPLGDPIDIFLMGFHLSLRHDEAELIDVENMGMHPCPYGKRHRGWRKMFRHGWKKFWRKGRRRR
ncbi:ferrous iron transport protein A [Candidatus Margulisiibacteriota bacterium]